METRGVRCYTGSELRYGILGKSGGKRQLRRGSCLSFGGLFVVPLSVRSNRKLTFKGMDS